MLLFIVTLERDIKIQYNDRTMSCTFTDALLSRNNQGVVGLTIILFVSQQCTFLDIKMKYQKTIVI